MSKKTIAVHDTTFHSDETFAVFLLHNTAEFEGAEVIRTRNQSIIDTCDVVCDVGGEYDHERRRYDHHQPSFNFKFPESEIPCAAAGTVYYHYGKEVIANILKKNNRDAGEYLDYIYKRMYFGFVQEIDAIDNGVSQYPPEAKAEYTLHTDISSRIARLNPHWRCKDDPFPRFLKAIDMIGSEFVQCLLNLIDSDIPAIDITKKGFESRFEVDESGQIIVLSEYCPFSHTLKDLEESTECKPILYVIGERNSDHSWQIKALGTGNGFELRKPLPYRGLRDEELSQACGIPGGVFVHKSGFLGIFKQKEHAIQFAKLALNFKEESSQ